MTESPRASADERFLVLAPTGRDAALTCELLAKFDIDSVACTDMMELTDLLESEGAAGIIIAEEVLVPSAFHRLGEAIARQESWSDIPILLFTGENATIQARPATMRLLAPLGNVTLLDRPVPPITMVSAIQSALRARRRQYGTRHELLERRREVERRDQFLAMLGHELRNPLGAIVMAIEIMERTSSESPKHRGIVRRQATHLARLVDDLLDVSRVTSGKIALKREMLDLVELVHRCLGSIRPAFQAQSVGIELRAPYGAVWVEGDAVRLEQIVVNLLTNAVKYTPAGGHVEVSVVPEQDQAVFVVRDNGTGIASDILPHVFELFTQAQGTLDRAQGGMGIGLTLVKSLAELHGGRVMAESAGPGCGSTFTVRLPRRAPGAAKSVPTSRSTNGDATLPGLNMMIVEDNADSRELLQTIFEASGHRVTVAADGLAAVQQALEIKPRVMLVDIGLPGLDGYGVARKVRAALGDRVFMVALTGYGQPDDQGRALEAGFDMHLTKPVDLRSIQELLSRPEIARLGDGNAVA